MSKIGLNRHSAEVKTDKRSENRFILFLKLWGPVFIWCSLIFILSNQPDLTLNLPDELIMRKSAHAVEYAVLTLLLFRALYNWQRKGPALQMRLKINCIILSIVLVLFFSISDGFHQTFIPGRNGTPYDVIIDSLGMMVAGLILAKK